MKMQFIFTVVKLIQNLQKKKLEQAGFGWVFDCEGIELEEVKE